jgi:DNA-directed RNA polymerase subunit RPC12/RpoP
MGMNKCVECGDHVPSYQKYLCEECWKQALNEKLREEDKDGKDSSRH